MLKPGLAVAHSPAKVTRGKAGVLLTCPRGTSGCSGTLTLSVHQRVVVRRHGHRSAVTRTVTVGRARFSLAAGASRTVWCFAERHRPPVTGRRARSAHQGHRDDRPQPPDDYARPDQAAQAAEALSTGTGPFLQR